MNKAWIWRLAKGLELVGMVVVLWGLVTSMRLGMNEDGLASMAYSGYGLLWGGGIFLVGYLLERGVGAR